MIGKKSIKRKQMEEDKRRVNHKLLERKRNNQRLLGQKNKYNQMMKKKEEVTDYLKERKKRKIMKMNFSLMMI